jgi:hypothetical protein
MTPRVATMNHITAEDCAICPDVDTGDISTSNDAAYAVDSGRWRATRTAASITRIPAPRLDGELLTGVRFGRGHEEAV